MNKTILIRYGELVLKRKNRKHFIKILKENIENQLKTKVNAQFDRMYIDYSKKNLDGLKYIFGISSYSVVTLLEMNIDLVKNHILKIIQEKSNVQTFKISSKRNNKSFKYNSMQLNNMLGKFVLTNSNWKVDVHNPDIQINIEVRRESIAVFENSIQALGGLPVGVSGKVLCLLSGGIDSPVAAFKLIKRGLKVDFLSFITPPQTDEKTVDKMMRVIKLLNRYQPQAKYYLANYSALMNYIGLVSNQAYKINLMRRSFYRIAEQICKKDKYLAIANGDNIGQVASQTLESINVIRNVCSFPIFSPLLTNDKIETINIAKEIETYDISIEKANETCELFAPEKPIIKPTLFEAQKLEEELSMLNDLEKSLLENDIEILKITDK
ncbi:tRNA uracil 4-sulfurtransferase ThiI [Mycoplasma phocimorsus]|uniref:tRNA uracil 4-sulfurtransferase ThiI n=1 Tax=Mycoplasma phocimorsus TaxID=3045839 RepID=UPI0024C04D95|nr:tRNA uracil 4-sulfurtransferase ThiI [Mycoplasma phocimorsus]MDJ1647661.1 tRNA uracil 4-sulfurtransferase ThiI [Mycoplasma phocimorsus]